MSALAISKSAADGMHGQCRYARLGTVLGHDHDLVHFGPKPVGEMLVDVIRKEVLLPDRDHGGVADALDEASLIFSPNGEITFFEQPVTYIDAGDILQAANEKPHMETSNVPPRIIFLLLAPFI